MQRRASITGAPVGSRPSSAPVGQAPRQRWQLPQWSLSRGASYSSSTSSRISPMKK
jgi:hypothetical protein